MQTSNDADNNKRRLSESVLTFWPTELISNIMTYLFAYWMYWCYQKKKDEILNSGGKSKQFLLTCIPLFWMTRQWLSLNATDCYQLKIKCFEFFIARYLFNCGEGTQRIFNQHKLRLTRVNNIFFTRICWKYIGGLPGFAMTLRDNGKSDVGLLGPSNLPQFIHATRFFLFHERLKFDCTGFTGGEGEKYEDENLTIWPVLLNG